MRRFNPPDSNDPYNNKGFPNTTQDQFNFPPNPNTQGSPSRQHLCKPQFPNSPSVIRKQQSRNLPLYRFQTLNESNTSAPSFTQNEILLEEPQLPHYVVPVLYVPQRIITNEELISSEVFDQLSQDNSFEDGYQGVPTPMPSQRQIPPQTGSYYQTRRPRSPRYEPSNRNLGAAKSRLSNSETEIYDKLMERMYGFKNPDEENDNPEDYTRSANDVQRQGRQALFNESIISNPTYRAEERKPEFSSPTSRYALDPEKSSVYMASCYPETRATASCMKASSFTQEYATRLPDEYSSFSPSNSAYTVSPVRQTEYFPQKPVKDYHRFADMGTLAKPRDMSPSRMNKIRESIEKPQRKFEIPVQESINSNFNTNLVPKRETPESKFTQTTSELSISTQTGDHRVHKKTSGYEQKAEKGPTKQRINGKCLNCSDADVTVIIDRGSNEDVYTVLGGGPQYPNELQESKCDKSTEYTDTVGLLPFESGSLGPIEKKLSPKLRTHSRIASPIRKCKPQ